jgi:hypothetical protein
MEAPCPTRPKARQARPPYPKCAAALDLDIYALVLPELAAEVLGAVASMNPRRRKGGCPVPSNVNHCRPGEQA